MAGSPGLGTLPPPGPSLSHILVGEPLPGYQENHTHCDRQCFCWVVLRQFTWGTPSVCALNLGQLWPPECQPKVFHKHFSSQKMVGQIVIWLMRISSGCPCGYATGLFCFRTRYCMPCGLSAWQACRCWLPGMELRWPVGCVYINSCSGWGSIMMFISQRNPPYFAGVENSSVLHSELYAWPAANLWVASSLRPPSVSLQLRNKCIYRTGTVSGLTFTQASFHFSKKLSHVCNVSWFLRVYAGNVISGILDSVIQERGWDDSTQVNSFPKMTLKGSLIL